jgi:predicted Zn-dependent peptidase
MEEIGNRRKSYFKSDSHPTRKQSITRVNKEDKETTFYIGAPGVSRNNPDYVAIEVVNTLFGGRFTSC